MPLSTTPEKAITLEEVTVTAKKTYSKHKKMIGVIVVVVVVIAILYHFRNKINF